MRAPASGLVQPIAEIATNINEGDAMYHIASLKKTEETTAFIEELRDEMSND